MEVKIRLNNTKLGITTVWSLQKFEAKLMHMREIYQVKQTVNFNRMSVIFICLQVKGFTKYVTLKKLIPLSLL